MQYLVCNSAKILTNWEGQRKGTEIIKGLKRCHFIKDPGAQPLLYKRKKADILYTPRWEENSMLQSFFSLKLMFKLLSLRVINYSNNSSFSYFNKKLKKKPKNIKGRNP